ncbi:MAG: winged helix-turn-helix domain-containing protein [Christensenellaceae bacterium]|jgi:hypothetical protein|nr:winged helix-turn-helix domain-containing protein [Christensenellaceae bacterium]
MLNTKLKFESWLNNKPEIQAKQIVETLEEIYNWAFDKKIIKTQLYYIDNVKSFNQTQDAIKKNNYFKNKYASKRSIFNTSSSLYNKFLSDSIFHSKLASKTDAKFSNYLNTHNVDNNNNLLSIKDATILILSDRFPLTLNEIYDEIVSRNLYIFDDKNPEKVLFDELQSYCVNTNLNNIENNEKIFQYISSDANTLKYALIDSNAILHIKKIKNYLEANKDVIDDNKKQIDFIKETIKSNFASGIELDEIGLRNLKETIEENNNIKITLTNIQITNCVRSFAFKYKENGYILIDNLINKYIIDKIEDLINNEYKRGHIRISSKCLVDRFSIVLDERINGAMLEEILIKYGNKSYTKIDDYIVRSDAKLESEEIEFTKNIIDLIKSSNIKLTKEKILYELCLVDSTKINKILNSDEIQKNISPDNYKFDNKESSYLYKENSDIETINNSSEISDEGKASDTTYDDKNIQNLHKDEFLIRDAAIQVLNESNPLSIDEIYEKIMRYGLYDFGARNPKNALYEAINSFSRGCTFKGRENNEIMFEKLRDGKVIKYKINENYKSGKLNERIKDDMLKNYPTYESNLLKLFNTVFEDGIKLDRDEIKNLKSVYENCYLSELSLTNDLIYQIIKEHLYEFETNTFKPIQNKYKFDNKESTYLNKENSDIKTINNSSEISDEGKASDTDSDDKNVQNLHKDEFLIRDTAIQILKESSPLSMDEIYEKIMRYGLYDFGARDPKNVLYEAINSFSRGCTFKGRENNEIMFEKLRDGKVIKYKINENYKSGKINERIKDDMQKNYPTYESNLLKLFNTVFKDGIKLDNYGIKKLKSAYENRFLSELSLTNDLIFQIIKEHLYEYETNTFKPLENLISNATISDIENMIDAEVNKGHTRIHIDTLCNYLLTILNIEIDAQMLISLLKKHGSKNYSVDSQYIYYNEIALDPLETEFTRSIFKTLNSSNSALTIDKIKGDLPFYDNGTILTILNCCSSIVKTRYEEYILISKINLSSTVRDEILDFAHSNKLDLFDNQKFKALTQLEKNISKVKNIITDYYDTNNSIKILQYIINSNKTDTSNTKKQFQERRNKSESGYTLKEACILVLKNKSPLTFKEIYNEIIRLKLFTFKAKNPEGVVNGILVENSAEDSRGCKKIIFEILRDNNNNRKFKLVDNYDSSKIINENKDNLPNIKDIYRDKIIDLIANHFKDGLEFDEYGELQLKNSYKNHFSSELGLDHDSILKILKANLFEYDTDKFIYIDNLISNTTINKIEEIIKQETDKGHKRIYIDKLYDYIFNNITDELNDKIDSNVLVNILLYQNEKYIREEKYIYYNDASIHLEKEYDEISKSINFLLNSSDSSFTIQDIINEMPFYDDDIIKKTLNINDINPNNKPTEYKKIIQGKDKKYTSIDNILLTEDTIKSIIEKRNDFLKKNGLNHETIDEPNQEYIHNIIMTNTPGIESISTKFYNKKTSRNILSYIIKNQSNEALSYDDNGGGR